MDHDEFLAFARRLGVHIAPDQLVADGRIRRADVDGDRSGKNDAAYLLREDGSGWVTNFKASGKPEHFRRGAQQDLTAEEQAALAAQRAARQAEQIERNRLAVVDSVEQWESSREAKDFPYLCEPRLDPAGLRQCRGRLLVPLLRFDAGGELGWAGMQRIDPAPPGTSPDKRFVPGTPTSGSFAVIPIQGSGVESPLDSFDAVRNAPRVVFCEGVGTALAIHQETGLPVIAAMSAQNLPEVARALHDKLRGAVVVYADNDGDRAQYKGQVYAVRAARVMGSARARIALPQRAGGVTPPGYDARDQLREARGAIAETIAKALRAEELERRIPTQFRAERSAPTARKERPQPVNFKTPLLQRDGPIALRGITPVIFDPDPTVARGSLEERTRNLNPNPPAAMGAAGLTPDQEKRRMEPSQETPGEELARTTAAFNRERDPQKRRALRERIEALRAQSREAQPREPTPSATAPEAAQAPDKGPADPPPAEPARDANTQPDPFAEMNRAAEEVQEAAPGAAEETPEERLLRQYREATAPQREARAKALRELEGRHREEQGALFDALGQLRSEKERELAPLAEEHRKSLIALEVAKRIETLHKTQAGQRKDLAAQMPPVPSLRNFLEERAGSDPAAARMLEEEVRREGQAESIRGRRAGEHEPVTLEGLTWEVDASDPKARAVHYARDGERVMSDRGERLDLYKVEDREIEAALRLAEQKYDMETGLVLTGSREFQSRAAEIAGRIGIKVRNEELQAVWRAGRQQAMQEGAPGDEPPAPPAGIESGRNPAPDLDQASQEHFLAEGVLARMQPAAWSALEKAGRRQALSPDEREALHRDRHADLVDGEDRLTPLGEVVHARMQARIEAERERLQQQVAERIGINVRNEQLQAPAPAGIESGRNPAPDLDQASQEHFLAEGVHSLAEGVLARMQPAAWSALEKARRRQVLSPEERAVLHRDRHAELIDGKDRLTLLGEVVHARMQARIETERERLQQQLRSRNVDEEMEQRKREESAHGRAGEKAAEVASERPQERIEDRQIESPQRAPMRARTRDPEIDR